MRQELIGMDIAGLACVSLAGVSSDALQGIRKFKFEDISNADQEWIIIYS